MIKSSEILDRNRKDLNEYLRENQITNLLCATLMNVPANAVSHYRTDRPNAMPKNFLFDLQKEYIKYLEQKLLRLKKEFREHKNLLKS